MSFKTIKTYSMTSTINFGKYKGYSVGTIVETDPHYLLWVKGHIPTIAFDSTVLSALYESNSTWDICDATEIDIY
jgi:hypothetical protein